MIWHPTQRFILEILLNRQIDIQQKYIEERDINQKNIKQDDICKTAFFRMTFSKKDIQQE
jgi:hypothetical protein